MTIKTQIAVFHPGTQHSWQTAEALQQINRLAFYATSIFYQPDRWPYRVERYMPNALRTRMHAEFRRFEHPGLDQARVRTAGAAEWFERLARRAGLRGLANHIDAYGNRHFLKHLRSEIVSSADFALWGYDSSSLDTFRLAKACGRNLILDRTIGDWRAYNAEMDHIHDRYAEFFLSPSYRVDQTKIDRDDAEYAIADVILTGSPFAADTICTHASDRDVPGRVRVLNYCYDEALFAHAPPPQSRAANAPLEFLVLGQAGVRKGIHLVLKVFDRIAPSAARLTIVGDLQIPRGVFARYVDRVVYRPTVARADVPAIMAAADILLFPSYFEGSALSLLEGLAAGMGLIQSVNAGVGVTPETGLLLPELSEEALYAAVMTAIEDRQRVDGWRTSAQIEAKRYSFGRYRDNIDALLSETGL